MLRSLSDTSLVNMKGMRNTVAHTRAYAIFSPMVILRIMLRSFIFISYLYPLTLSKFSPHKYTKNLRNNGRMRVKFDKWLVHIPFLCYLTILLISAEGAVYGGY